jgi:hypothetical protein
MISARVDPDGSFARALSDFERRQVPFATQQAINATAFETRKEWAEAMPRVFDRPTALTTNAVLYRKATRANLTADIFIRDEAFKGTPPAKYLLAQVEGGTRRRKGLEARLGAKGLLPDGMFVVPGAGAELDNYGNIRGSTINRILSQLGARFDPLQNETDVSRGRRQRREKKKGDRRGDHFALRRSHGRLQPGVYQRISTGFGSAVQSVLRFVDRVHYGKRYDIFGMAQKIYDSRFPANFRREFDKAMASARARS